MQNFKNCGKMREGVIGFFIPNKLDLTFQAPNLYGKFYQIRIKIAAVGVFTGRLTDRRK